MIAGVIIIWAWLSVALVNAAIRLTVLALQLSWIILRESAGLIVVIARVAAQRLPLRPEL